MKSVLFVCYGSGHVRMVVPVAQALQASGLARVRVLGLTTAAVAVKEAGLPLVQVKDFVEPGDADAVAHGERLAASMGPVGDPQETRAYLGLCYAELEADCGAQEAVRRYSLDGRQAFLPVRLLERIVRRLAPDLVVATNSPRGERAAIIAASRLGLPSICIVDLFAIDEEWIGRAGYANRICVLNEHVRQFLLKAGRQPAEVVATGNPAFDLLHDPAVVRAGLDLRRVQGWEGRKVLLWPIQEEPQRHPFDGRPGDPTLPARALQSLVEWTLSRPEALLCIRPRAGQALPQLPQSPQVVATGQDWPLHPLLHAVDIVVTLTSTVGLEGRMAGARLVQVLGSVFDDAMPLALFGLTDAAVPLSELPAALDRVILADRQVAQRTESPATPKVVAELLAFL